MFSNLKNKLIEEVKASKLQQFASAAQAAVTSSSSTTPSNSDSTATNENFFSITEEDTPQNSPFKPVSLTTPSRASSVHSFTPHNVSNGNGTGAIPRTRRLSNSSMASDISFRLPSYDPSSMYHMQSDYDMSGSEMDDSASTTKLDTISKEQLYDAYRKSLDRYHKYRVRYTDLATKYKDLERDSTKARAVLVETQDKAIRRLSELREQCNLEQQAKAHLEESLRMEMDDMNCKLQAYQTKLKLLGENPDSLSIASSKNLLIDLDTSNEESSNQINDGDFSQRVKDLEEQLEEKERQFEDLQQKLAESSKIIDSLKKSEEENALLLAQTKQAIHSELEAKENEVKLFKENIKQLQNELQNLQKREMNLTSQLEDIQELKKKYKQLELLKQENDAKVIASEHILSQTKEQYAVKDKLCKALEEKLANLTKEKDGKLQDLKRENQQLNEMIQRYQQNEISLAEVDNELNRTKNENDILKANIKQNSDYIQTLVNNLKELKEEKENYVTNLAKVEVFLGEEKSKSLEFQKLLEDSQRMLENEEQKTRNLEKDLKILNEQKSNNDNDIDNEIIASLQFELKNLQESSQNQIKQLKDFLNNKEQNLEISEKNLNALKEELELHLLNIKKQSEEISVLNARNQEEKESFIAFQNEAKLLQDQKDLEKADLQSQFSNILEEIKNLGEEMEHVKVSHSSLEEEKKNLEKKIENMEKASSEGNHQFVEALSSSKLFIKDLEKKLQTVESENSQLLERNCLLEENLGRMEKQIQEFEKQNAGEDATSSELRVKLATAEDALQKLNEKMSQILDENSRLLNSQELMDHDYRTLQDRFDALEKEKLSLLDNQNVNDNELVKLKDQLQIESNTKNELLNKLQTLDSELQEEKQKFQTTVDRMNVELESFKRKAMDLNQELIEVKNLQANESDLKDLLESKQQEHNELKKSHEQLAAQKIEEVGCLKSLIASLEQKSQQQEKDLEELNLLRDQKASLIEELEIAKKDLEIKESITTKLETEVVDLENLKEILQNTKEQLQQLTTKNSTLEDSLQDTQKELEENLSLLNVLQEDVKDKQQIIKDLENFKNSNKHLENSLVEMQNTYEKKIVDIESKIEKANNEVKELEEIKFNLSHDLEKSQENHKQELIDLKKSLDNLQQDYNQLKEEASVSSEKLKNLPDYEQLKVENEFLNTHIKQLEVELEKQKHEVVTNSLDSEDLKTKFKSLQCELYVLKDNAAEYETQMKVKDKELNSVKDEFDKSILALKGERLELKRQTDHAEFVTQQNDKIQKELLQTQHHLGEVENKLQETSTSLKELQESSANKDLDHEQEISSLKSQLETKEVLLTELKRQCDVLVNSSEGIKHQLESEIKNLKNELEEHSIAKTQKELSSSQKSLSSDAEHLREMNNKLQKELEDLSYKSRMEIEGLKHENDELQINNSQLEERMNEFKASHAELTHKEEYSLIESSSNLNANIDKSELEAKLKTIMAEVQEVSNRNLFLEQQCENYLILEQSNERLKLQNAKLSRQLDETLVSVQHNEGITATTEFEYLKNIMFQYLTGSANGNNETLVKVISAVLKFSPQQTQVALEKEHQRRSLLNKII